MYTPPEPNYDVWAVDPETGEPLYRAESMFTKEEARVVRGNLLKIRRRESDPKYEIIPRDE